ELAEQAADSSSSHEARETIDPISTDLAPPPAPIETEEVASEPLWSAVPAEPETSNDAELELSAPLAEETSELWGEAAAPEEPSPSADPQEASPSESLWGEVAAEPTAEVVAEGGWEPAPATPTTESEDLWDVE